MALTKNIIVEKLYRNGGYTRHRAADLVGSVLGLIKDCLADGNDLLISGFGRFTIHDKQSRMGRNPYTGEKMVLRARRVATFKPSRVLKRQMNAR
ncbi:MAG: integration host factor subunit alpha [Deltaproteobacteria bacterium]|nr:integration host factor subunit alpha [Deltaproteobacteria bacterium]